MTFICIITSLKGSVDNIGPHINCDLILYTNVCTWHVIPNVSCIVLWSGRNKWHELNLAHPTRSWITQLMYNKHKAKQGTSPERGLTYWFMYLSKSHKHNNCDISTDKHQPRRSVPTFVQLATNHLHLKQFYYHHTTGLRVQSLSKVICHWLLVVMFVSPSSNQCT